MARGRSETLKVLLIGAALLFILIAVPNRVAFGPTDTAKDRGKGPEVTPLEDLMREHGLLRRILLIYGEAARRLETGTEPPPEVLPEAAGIVRNFIEKYHEELEEDHLFPKFRKAGRQEELVRTLLEQHKAGRKVTERIMGLASSASRSREERNELADLLRQFIRMYEPHAAREDTVLFPDFHHLVTTAEYRALGDRFEDRERELFGEGGFEGMVARAAALEQKLGIADLAKFTPSAKTP